VAESFFATVKVELVHDAAWATRAGTHANVFEYIEQFYNGQRRHSSLGYLSPLTFERRWARKSGPRRPPPRSPFQAGLLKTRVRGGSRNDADEGGRYLVSPSRSSVSPIAIIRGILETAPRTAIHARATCLVTP